jgi:hypothetical protein
MLRLDVHGTMFEIVLKSMPPVQNEPAAAALACGFNSAVVATWLQHR